MQHGITENLVYYSIGHIGFVFFIIESLLYLEALKFVCHGISIIYLCDAELFCHNMHQHIRHFALSNYTIIVYSKHCFIQIPNLIVCDVFVNFGNHLAIVTNDIKFQSLSYEYLNGRLLWSSFSSMK